MELEVKLKELEATASKLETILAEKEKTIEGLKSQIESLSEENKKLDKLLSIEREKVLAIEAKAREEKELKAAETFMDSILSESQVPERLHAKVKSQIDYKKFKGDNDVFDEGSEAFTKFAEAFKAEVKEWEASIGNVLKIGLTEGKSHDNSIDSDLSEYARNLARQFAGHIRSDEK